MHLHTLSKSNDEYGEGHKADSKAALRSVIQKKDFASIKTQIYDKAYVKLERSAGKHSNVF